MKEAKPIVDILIKAFINGNKLLVCGNGGSATMASHMAAEFINKFEHERRPLPAVALTTDTACLTSISNDRGYEFIFVRQLQALGKPGDVLIGFSSSGNSSNVNLALICADRLKMESIDFPRNGKTTAEIQEYQLKLMHEVVRQVERAFL